MTGGPKAIKIPIVVAAILSLLTPPAYAQSLKKGSHAPPAESRPPIDEKAYKAALDRIPTPKQGYDPWGQARQSEPAKTPNKPNQYGPAARVRALRRARHRRLERLPARDYVARPRRLPAVLPFF
jgi:hypothetical protein